MLIAAMAAMMLGTGFASAAFAGGDDDGPVAKGGDGGDGGIGIGIGVCAIIASCDDVGSNNGAGGDGGDAKVVEDD
jgi:hypothetical protein